MPVEKLIGTSVSAADESWFVEARGSGETSVLARDEAVREALRSTMGALITAETILEDGDVMEKIVSYTDGFLEDYVVLEEEERDDFWHVLIMAQVRPGELLNTLNGVGVSTQLIKGKVLAARARFQISQRKSAGLMIRRALSDMKGIIEAKVTGEPILGRAEGSSVALSIPVRITLISGRYRDWYNKYVPWFEKLAVAKKKTLYPVDLRRNSKLSLREELNMDDPSKAGRIKECVRKAFLGLGDGGNVGGPNLIIDNLKQTSFWIFTFDLEEEDFPSRSPFRSGSTQSLKYRAQRQGVPHWKMTFLDGDGEEIRDPAIVFDQGGHSIFAAPFDHVWIVPAIPYGLRPSNITFDYRTTLNRHFEDNTNREIVVKVSMPLDALEQFEKCSVSLCWPEWK
jgi:hypothetical protein